MIVFLPLQSFAKAVVFYRKQDVGMNEPLVRPMLLVQHEPLVRPMLLVQHFSILFFIYLIGLCMTIYQYITKAFWSVARFFSALLKMCFFLFDVLLDFLQSFSFFAFTINQDSAETFLVLDPYSFHYT